MSDLPFDLNSLNSYFSYRFFEKSVFCSAGRGVFEGSLKRERGITQRDTEAAQRATERNVHMVARSLTTDHANGRGWEFTTELHGEPRSLHGGEVHIYKFLKRGKVNRGFWVFGKCGLARNPHPLPPLPDFPHFVRRERGSEKVSRCRMVSLS